MMISERKNTRGRIEILASILVHCKEGIKKTHIMCKANVGYEQLCYYLPNLINAGLVTQAIENGSVIYRTTDSGREFLKSYFDIMRLLAYRNHNNSTQLTCEKDSEVYWKYKNEPNEALIAILEETEV
jgi:predicted transcriptional regulator